MPSSQRQRRYRASLSSLTLPLNAPANATTGSVFNFGVTEFDGTNNVVPGYPDSTRAPTIQPLLPVNSSLTNEIGTFAVTLILRKLRSLIREGGIDSARTPTAGCRPLRFTQILEGLQTLRKCSPRGSHQCRQSNEN